MSTHLPTSPADTPHAAVGTPACGVRVGALAGRRWVALDLDGVIWAGSDALPGAVVAVRRLREAGLHIYFVSNGTGSRAELVHRLGRLGVPCEVEHVSNAGRAAARCARQLTGDWAPVLVLGGAGLDTECAAARLIVTTDPAQVGAVLVGSSESFNYAQLVAASSALRRGVPLVGCNRDTTFPGEGGVPLPGCGAVLAAVEAAAGRLADVVVGKPAPGLLTDLWEPTGTSAADWFVVGDSADADLGLAAAAGVPGVLLGHPGCGYPDLAGFTAALLAA